VLAMVAPEAIPIAKPVNVLTLVESFNTSRKNSGMIGMVIMRPILVMKRITYVINTPGNTNKLYQVLLKPILGAVLCFTGVKSS